MAFEPEKIELVRDRARVSHAEAQEALAEADGSVIDAIIILQDKKHEDERSKAMEFNDKVNEVTEKAKEVAEEVMAKVDKEKLAEYADKAKEYAEKAVEAGKKGVDKASEYVINKETLTEAYDKAKDVAGKAVEKGQELYKQGMELAEEYKVKEKVEKFIDKVGEEASKINEVKKDNQ